MGRHQRAASFSGIDSTQASVILSSVLQENNVFLGGCSVGNGLHKAVKYYLDKRSAASIEPYHLSLPGATNLTAEAGKFGPEEAFYVVDIGVVVSQVYQWRRFFPRVEPFYAVKCNPDPVIVKTLAILGCNFDCASKTEIRIVEECTTDLPRKPDIIFANPCKGRKHLIEAVCKGITKVTFDNVVEVAKCAAISKKIQLILRIITDDRGSQCRLSSKFGAPPTKWRPLLEAAKKHGLEVIGVSFHVGSGCRDASRYEAALKDAREIFDMAKEDFGFKMSILDIGGGFPGETHSIWNPAAEIDEDESVSEGISEGNEDNGDDNHFKFFTEIAEQVAPVIDLLFPPEEGVRIISEPGRYFVAAAATLLCSVISARTNECDESFEAEPINDEEAAEQINQMSRSDGEALIISRGRSLSVSGETPGDDRVLNTIQEEFAEYSMLFASQQLAQQEFDVYNDMPDLTKDGFTTASNMLGPPEDHHLETTHHTVEGMSYHLAGGEDDQEPSGLLTLASAGEAAVNGIVLQAVADSAPLQDDYSYYINDGVYGAFNNIMFDHASIRPRVFRTNFKVDATEQNDGFMKLTEHGGSAKSKRPSLFASTVFGPTCDSIDVIARSVLLPRLEVGDWMYFHNMGAYTMAASSSFNGFEPSEKFYVCSVQPEYFPAMIVGPQFTRSEEIKNKESKAEHDA